MQATAVEDVEEALRTDPDDPASWREYADWLSEHGDARGELIRLEQQMTRTRPADRPAVQLEIADLVAQRESEWQDGLPAGVRVLKRRYGFAVAVAVDWSDEVHDVIEQVLRGRFVTALRIRPDETTESIPQGEEWGDWEDFDSSPQQADLATRLAGLDLGRLAELDLSYMYLGPEGAEGLVPALATGRLRALDLRYCYVGDAGVAALAGCPGLSGLRRLHLQRNEVRAEGVRRLHQLRELTELDLRYDKIGEEGAQALLDAPFVSSLTRLFEGVPLELELEPSGWTELAEGVFSCSLQMPEQARDRLSRLDELDLYVSPLNAASRGGMRFIFHSALLAEALSAAVGETLPPAVGEGFSHVNPVFRCNRFEPGDANFHRHLDTPYFDAARRHISRYTLLVYLTGGTGSPALDLPGGAALTEIGEFTCVVFDQRFEHEGAPYRDGRKVFLRTELIFTADDLAEAPQIGELFSKACYLTGESVFAPELARHADDYYNRVAAAHWNGPGRGPAREAFLHKEFRGVHFVANGYDFWFPKADGLPLVDCAAITLLDYFNCKIGGTAFRSLCHTEVIESDNADWIPEFLHARSEPGRSTITRIDKTLLFPEPEEPNSQCCPNHGPSWDPTRHDDLIKLYARA